MEDDLNPTEFNLTKEIWLWAIKSFKYEQKNTQKAK